MTYQVVEATRDYSRVRSAIDRAHDEEGTFGIDWATLSEGWRRALRRVGHCPGTLATLTPEPTRYELLCGGVWRYERAPIVIDSNGERRADDSRRYSVDLWQECPGLAVYHVRASCFDPQVTMRAGNPHGGIRLYWDTYESLEDAKRAFRDAIATPSESLTHRPNVYH